MNRCFVPELSQYSYFTLLFYLRMIALRASQDVNNINSRAIALKIYN